MRVANLHDQHPLPRYSISLRKFALAATLLGGGAPQLGAQQPPPDPHAGHGAIAVVKPEFPRLGKAQEKPAAPLFSLAEAETLALANNPTLRQAEAEIRTAQARQKQAGLYPNPSVGYSGEEIRGGSFGGGQQGFFISQSIVTAGKLGLQRAVAGHSVRISEIEAEEQRMRVMNGIRLGFYRALAAQEMLEVKRDLLRISADGLRTAQQLRNIGQADETEVLQAEVEHQQSDMSVAMQEQSLRQAWRSLAALLGKPGLEVRTLVGNLEADLPAIDEAQALQRITVESPAVQIAGASADRSRALLAREKREPIPDIEVRGGLQRNGEIIAAPRYRAGLQGFAEVGVRIPLFDRNQGNVAAAKYQAERADREVERVQLVLRERASSVLDIYQSSRIMTERYRTQLLPRMRQSYELLLQKYGTMTASYPQALRAQRMLYQMQGEYVAALESHWMAALTLQGLLLTDALEAPARPADVDLPVREINIPSGPRIRMRE